MLSWAPWIGIKLASWLACGLRAIPRVSVTRAHTTATRRIKAEIADERRHCATARLTIYTITSDMCIDPVTVRRLEQHRTCLKRACRLCAIEIWWIRLSFAVTTQIAGEIVAVVTDCPDLTPTGRCSVATKRFERGNVIVRIWVVCPTPSVRVWNMGRVRANVQAARWINR